MFKSIYDTDEDDDIDVTAGGTGVSAWTQYLIPYANTTTSLSQIAIGSTAQVLTSNGPGIAPSFQSDKATLNNLINGFRIAVNGTLTVYKILDGIVDYFYSEAGVDGADSTNESYDSGNDLYKPSGGFPATMKLYLQCNGADESTDFPDQSASEHSVSAEGNAQVDTTIKKFGTGSALFAATTDYLSIPEHADFDFGSGEFTIQFQIYWLAVAQKYLIEQYDSGDDGAMDIFYETGVLQFLNWNGSSWGIWIACDWTPVQDTWYHIEIGRSGSDWYMFIDGVSKEITKYQGEYANAMYDQDGPFWINHSLGNGAQCHMDEIRIDKALLHSEGFTPPTGEFASTWNNMTLISECVEAETQPKKIRILALEEDVDAITVNTDIKAWGSRDDGANWVQGTIVDEGDYDASKKIFSAEVDVSAQAADKTIRWKFSTLNNKMLYLHGVSMRWD